MSHWQRAGLVSQQNLACLQTCKGLIDSTRSLSDFCSVLWSAFTWENQSTLAAAIDLRSLALFLRELVPSTDCCSFQETFSQDDLPWQEHWN